MGKQKFNLWKKNVYLSDCIQIDNLDNQKITLLNPNDKSVILYTDKENDRDMAFSIFKCLPFERAMSYLTCPQHLTFVSPYLWYDPFDYLFYDENKIEGKLYCFVASYSRAYNEEAVWKSYANSNTANIWSLDFIKLLEQLSSVSNNNVDFYVSLIDYSYKKLDLIDIRKQLNSNPSQPLSLHDVLNNMSLKRKAFKYEDEIRIFAHVKGEQIPTETKDFKMELLKKSVNGSRNNSSKTLLSKVLLPPYPPKKKGEFDEIQYSKLQQIQNRGFRDFYENFDVRIEESRLYVTNENITKLI